MILKLKKSLAFVGMMGAGKTAVGRIVADKLRAEFVDSDKEIEDAAKMSVAEIFARDGESFFRQREAEVIQRLLQNETCVLSTGGGAFMNAVVRDTISSFAASIWLKADLDLLWSRVKNKHTRPLLKKRGSFIMFTEMYEMREKFYMLSDITVEAEKGISVDAMADRVISALSAREDILEIFDGI